MGLLSELRRRNVFRVAIAYIIIAWLILQVGDTLAPALHLGEWVNTVLAFFLILGFPIALFFAWAFELTPEGLKKEKEVDRSQSITHVTGRRLDYVIIAVLVLTLGYFAFDKFVLDASRDAELVQTTTEAVTEQAIESGNAEAADKSIAVLPFRNRSAVAEDVYFVDGIHDDILTQLAKLSSFGKVISRTSMEQYRETSKSMPQIGQELGVATILEGGVQRAGDRVRINVQLIEAATDEHLWAETYDRELTVENIFLVQEEIAREVTKALRLTLTSQDDNSLSKVPTTNLDAYRLYHLGNQEVQKATTASLVQAIEYFEEAIRADPDYAQAYAGLADAYLDQMFRGSLASGLAINKAKPIAEKAIQLNPVLAEGYAALGTINQVERRWADAEINFHTAIALSPNLVSTRVGYGMLLGQVLFRVDEGITQLEEAARLSPLDPLVHAYLGVSYAIAHRSQDALDTLHYALKIGPGLPRTYEALGDVYYLLLGRLDEAVKWNVKGLETDPSYVRLRGGLVLNYLDLGDINSANLSLAMMQSPIIGEQSSVARSVQLTQLIYLRRYEEALEIAEELWRLRQRVRHAGNALQFFYYLNGQYERALEINELLSGHFEYIPHPETTVTDANLDQAINRAMILAGMGEMNRAHRLLTHCLDAATEAPVPSFHVGVKFHLVKIHALLGDTPNALLALRKAIDAGVRSGWWFDLLHSPATASLRSEPEFQELVEEIRGDMAAQLENVREMQGTGEIPRLPVVNQQ